MEMRRDFDLVLRGYDRSEVDAVVATVSRALESGDPVVKAEVVAMLRDAAFTMRFRGYDRAKVEGFVAEAQSSLTSR